MFTNPVFTGAATTIGSGSNTWTIDDTASNTLSFKLSSVEKVKFISGDGIYFEGTKVGSGSVTSVTGTSPVSVTTGSTPVVSLSSGYGDTQNPYASKAAKLFLATPIASAGVPTFRAIDASDIPTLNQNTTGSAAKWTTARNLAGNSVDGSTNVAFANKFIVQGTVDTGLSGAQFLGSLGTGILKNTTTTGVLSIAVASDFPILNQNTTGTAANVTGIVASANGGTGVNNGGRTLTIATNSGTLAFTNASTTLTVANNASISGTNTGDQSTITGNAGTATTLQTPRTFTIGSTGKTFNGGADVSWSLAEIGAASSSSLTSHTGSISNPHSVTASQVGLGTTATPTFASVTLGSGSNTWTIDDSTANTLTFKLGEVSKLTVGTYLISTPLAISAGDITATADLYSDNGVYAATGDFLDTVTSPLFNGGLSYTSNANPPTSANTNGLKIYVGSTDPTTKYAGWLYIIT